MGLNRAAGPSPPRYDSYPTRLDERDFQAVLDQAVDPEAFYRVEGWILRAMAAELLASRAGGRPKKGHEASDDLPGQLHLFGEIEK